MNSAVLTNIFRFTLLLSIQIIIFNKMNFLGYISPYPYILFIILYPVNSNKAGLLVASFALGLLMDLFSNSAGFHASSCVILAFCRPYLFRFAFGLSYEYQTIRLNDSLTPERFTFLLLSVVMHHLVLFALEAFKFILVLNTLLRTVVSSIFTLLLCILIIYSIKPNRQ
jgi:rod shape-determining protein MreD